MKSLLSLSIILCLMVTKIFAGELDCSHQDNKKQLEEIIEQINKQNKASNNPWKASKFSSFPVSLDEINELRGFTEDKLRLYLFSKYPEGPVRDKVRIILNSNWNSIDLRDLLDLESSAPFNTIDPDLPFGFSFPLIVYVGLKYSQKTEEAKAILDEQFRRFTYSQWEKYTSYKKVLFISSLARAFSDYGSLDIIPNSFWEAMKYEDIGPRMLKFLEKNGDEKTLDWLIEFSDNGGWKSNIGETSLKRCIKKLKNKLRNDSKAIPDPNRKQTDQSNLLTDVNNVIEIRKSSLNNDGEALAPSKPDNLHLNDYSDAASRYLIYVLLVVVFATTLVLAILKFRKSRKT